ncbi:hypothetical protein [Amycolatopsis sp. MtRt-6]|uniref:hypothetical protein n=1 Tax=Amycolatopsis sp. MtRt-6 TaxID=2792782 RepID=UPI001A8E22E2|nr:hypothetical protein [Amycolatopsis sp. MtRt-6]
MRKPIRNMLRRGAAAVSAALAVVSAAPGTATAAPAAGHDHRTVAVGGRTFEPNLFAGPTVLPATGGTVFVAGTGYNRAQGIFLAFCAVPDAVRPGNPATYLSPPTPCLPGRDSKDGSSRRITDAATGTPGITIPYREGGSFVTSLTNLRPELADGVVCDVNVRCAIVTRADFTATADRSYDLYIPVTFVR